MVNLELTIYLIGLFVILLGLLLMLRKGRLLEIPEGFENELPTTAPVSIDVTNPLVLMIKKLGKMTAYFANTEVWTDVYKHSQMSITDIARAQLNKKNSKPASTYKDA